MSLRYKNHILNYNADLSIARDKSMRIEYVQNAIHETHRIIDQLEEFDVDIFSLLGMRNLSAFVGEVFAASLLKHAQGLFCKNPHQDGYPDLLLMDEVGKKEWDSLSGRHDEKAPFSPFRTGGVEVKATCGSVPTPVQCVKLGLKKPQLGDQRGALLRGYDWKAHHQETNFLFGIVWDFIERKPCLVGLFYSSKLDTKYGPNNCHWGAIIQPREGGGRTTSVSIMKRAGVRLMYENWVSVIDDDAYIKFFNRYNDGDYIVRK